jgi:hypothetical protein
MEHDRGNEPCIGIESYLSCDVLTKLRRCDKPARCDKPCDVVRQENMKKEKNMWYIVRTGPNRTGPNRTGPNRTGSGRFDPKQSNPITIYFLSCEYLVVSPLSSTF